MKPVALGQCQKHSPMVRFPSRDTGCSGDYSRGLPGTWSTRFPITRCCQGHVEHLFSTHQWSNLTVRCPSSQGGDWHGSPNRQEKHPISAKQHSMLILRTQTLMLSLKLQKNQPAVAYTRRKPKIHNPTGLRINGSMWPQYNNNY